MIILSLLLCFASLVYLWILGFDNILPTLGWSAFLLPVAWVGLYASVRVKAYSRSIVSFVLVLFGFVVLNQVGALILDKTIPATSIWLFVLPVFVVWLPFTYTLEIITKKPVRKVKFKEGIHFFGLWLYCIGMWCLSMFFPVWADRPNPSRIVFLLYGPTFLYALLVFIMFLRMPREEFEYLMNAPVRGPGQAKRFKLITLIFLILTVASLGLEVVRGMWRFGVLGCSSLVLLSANIYLVYRLVFLTLPPKIDKPSTFHFPLSYTPLVFAAMSLPAWFFLYMLTIGGR